MSEYHVLMGRHLSALGIFVGKIGRVVFFFRYLIVPNGQNTYFIFQQLEAFLQKVNNNEMEREGERRLVEKEKRNKRR